MHSDAHTETPNLNTGRSFNTATTSPADSILPVKVVRKLAAESNLLPNTYASVNAFIPDIEASIPEGEVPPAELPAVIRVIYESEPKGEASASTLKLLLEMLLGQRSISEFIFGENGVYSTLADVAAPYLIVGASYLAKDEAKAVAYEDSIPEMLNGPVRHLAMLFLSLITSAFFAGVVILLVKRFVSHQKGNVGFAAGMVSLIAANFPLLVTGLREASVELRNLKNIAFA